ncbi:Hypp442 [Branchiostoma lanceolatum]|uniref:Hypp442 protein n=1 Tax=Branchiostoma lanceolatum TaxID=7740 RepID=A0A8J9VA96_BRALA|nr:Hypp442 [Branchiostoma lanceolatum]
MSDVVKRVLFYISEEDDYSPKAGAQDPPLATRPIYDNFRHPKQVPKPANWELILEDYDRLWKLSRSYQLKHSADNEDSGTQTLHMVDDIEEGLRQFERERLGEVTDQPKFPGSKGVEPISIPEMEVTKDAPVDEKLEAPPNDTDRLYTIDDILEALETEDGHLSLKDKQEKISLRTEESKKTVKAMRDGCRKRMKEEERRIRKRTWRTYSLDSRSDKMLAGLSAVKQALVTKQDDKEELSDRLPQLSRDKQEQMTESDDKKIVNKSAASPVHEGMGDVSESLISATHSIVNDGHGYVPQAHSEYSEKKRRRAHGNSISPSTPAYKLAGTSSESSDVRLTTDGVPFSNRRVSESDSHDRLSSEDSDKYGHEQTKSKANLNARGKVRRLLAGFRRVCRRLCCISDTSGSEE